MPAEPADREMLYLVGERKKVVVATRGMMGVGVVAVQGSMAVVLLVKNAHDAMPPIGCKGDDDARSLITR